MDSEPNRSPQAVGNEKNSPERSQSSELPLIKDLQEKAKSPQRSFCRICFSSANQDSLFTPCWCKGSIGFVHRRCLERWLETKNADNCELCHFQFVTIRTKKPFWRWCSDPSARIDRRNFIADVFCFLCLTPLGFASFWLCVQGAVYFLHYPRAVIEGVSLMAVACFLVFAYFTWLVMSLRYHYTVWMIWQNRNWAVRVIPSLIVEDESAAGPSKLSVRTVSVPITNSSDSSEDRGVRGAPKDAIIDVSSSSTDITNLSEPKSSTSSNSELEKH